MVNKRLFLSGVVALVPGVLVYVLARAPGSAHFLPEGLSFAVTTNGFSWLTGILPTVSHTIALSLMTAAVLPTSRKAALGVCLGWFLIEILFESGQHPLVFSWLSRTMGDTFIGMPLLEYTRAYFAQGTFDPYDILAAAAGAAFAFIVLLRLTPHERYQSLPSCSGYSSAQPKLKACALK